MGLVGGCDVDVLNVVVLNIGMLTVVLGSDVAASEVLILVVDKARVVVGRDVDILNVIVLVVGKIVVILSSDVVALKVVVWAVVSVALETPLNPRYISSVPRSIPSSRMLIEDARIPAGLSFNFESFTSVFCRPFTRPWALLMAIITVPSIK